MCKHWSKLPISPSKPLQRSISMPKICNACSVHDAHAAVHTQSHIHWILFLSLTVLRVCVCEFSHSLDVCHNSDVRTSFMIYTQNLFLLFCSFLVWAHEQLKTIIQFTHDYLVCFRECSFSEMHSIRSHSYRRAAYTQTYSNVKANA